MLFNMSFNTDAQARPLPSVAPVLVRRLGYFAANV
jgi:hypothetical protein